MKLYTASNTGNYIVTFFHFCVKIFIIELELSNKQIFKNSKGIS